VRLPARPADVRSVAGQKALAARYEGGVPSFRVDPDEADFVLLPR
jgi:hypothetical protein